MIKKLIFAVAMLVSTQIQAQKMMTKTGTVNFSASSPLEKIEGSNKAVACLLDTKTGGIDFMISVKSFVFPQKLMQEHFNENYMESDKYPKSVFKGTITNLASIKLNVDGEYPAQVAGKLTIHGVSKDVKTVGSIVVKNGKPTLKSNFSVLLTDYGIKIPGAVKDKISKEAKIDLNCSLEPMKK